MMFLSIFHWISVGFWYHFWCFFHTFTIRTCNPLNHQKALFFQWISMILLFRETWFLMIFMIFSVTNFNIYFFKQKDAKMDPKSDQNGTQNQPKNIFLRFWGVLGGSVFMTFLGTGKRRPKIRKNHKNDPRRDIDYSPGGMRGASGEVRRGSWPLRVSQILIKNSNLRIFSLEFQDLAKTLSLEF